MFNNVRNIKFLWIDLLFLCIQLMRYWIIISVICVVQFHLHFIALHFEANFNHMGYSSYIYSLMWILYLIYFMHTIHICSYLENFLWAMSVRSALFESLHSILSANKEERDSGEEKLKALEVTEGQLMYMRVCACRFVCIY